MSQLSPERLSELAATSPEQVATGWFAQNAPASQAQDTASADPALSSLQPQIQTGGGSYPLASVAGEGLMAPWTTPFQAPSVEQMQQDPSYQFRLQQGQQALERSAAARGTLLTGGTLKDLAGFAQGLASSEFDKIYNRNLGEYRQAYDIFNNNQSNQFNRLSALAGLGQNSAANLGAQGSSYAQNAGDLMTGAGNAQGAANIAAGNAYGGMYGNLGNLAVLGGMSWPQGGGSGGNSSYPWNAAYFTNF